MNDFQEHTDSERAGMAALSYIGLAMALVVGIGAASLIADYWTGLGVVAELIERVKQ